MLLVINWGYLKVLARELDGPRTLPGNILSVRWVASVHEGASLTNRRSAGRTPDWRKHGEMWGIRAAAVWPALVGWSFASPGYHCSGKGPERTLMVPLITTRSWRTSGFRNFQCPKPLEPFQVHHVQAARTQVNNLHDRNKGVWREQHYLHRGAGRRSDRSAVVLRTALN